MIKTNNNKNRITGLVDSCCYFDVIERVSILCRMYFFMFVVGYLELHYVYVSFEILFWIYFYVGKQCYEIKQFSKTNESFLKTTQTIRFIIIGTFCKLTENVCYLRFGVQGLNTLVTWVIL